MHPNLISAISLLMTELNLYSVELINDKNIGFCFRIPIGSKTGTGDLYYDTLDDELVLRTRYNTDNIINPESIVEDIAFVAWHWYLQYKDRDYDMSETWIPIWEKLGLVKKEVKTVTEYKIN